MTCEGDKNKLRRFFVVLSVMFGCAFCASVAHACTGDEIDVLGDGTQCEMAKFTVTTTALETDAISGNAIFRFNISATGTFYVDCGTDGMLSGTDASGKTIIRATTTLDQYTCTYTSGNVKYVRFGGVATGYSTSSTIRAVIQFGSDAANNGLTPTLVGGISGSLGALFPSLGNTNGLQPRFYQTFYQCTNLSGSIPSGLFTGISGTPASSMFASTFSGCSGLTGAIPSGLFGNLSGAPADSMFAYTFNGCTNLGRDSIGGTPTYGIPSGLFGNLSGAPANTMFFATFNNCTGLTGPIPSGLFGSLSGAPAANMFRFTFSNCSGLTGPIPSGLFGNLSGAPANTMFFKTFGGCSGLTGPIPSGLFGNISGTPAPYMFAETFSGCTNLGRDSVGGTPTYGIPSGLFGTPSGTPADYMFSSVFKGCSGLTGAIPSGLFGTPSGTPATYMFAETFSGCSNLTGAIPSGLFGAISGSPKASMFAGTFSNCSGLTGSIPSGLFGTPSGTSAGSMFASTFQNCGGLTGSIPSGLFGTPSGNAVSMFNATFSGCSSLTGAIPSGLFGTPSGTPAGSMFADTFNGCTNLGRDSIGGTPTYGIPSNLFENVSGAPEQRMFAGTFSGCSGLTGSIPSGLFGTISGTPVSGMFLSTFQNCSGLTGSIPDGLFGTLSGAPQASMFQWTFSGCSGLGGYVPKDIFQNITSYTSSAVFNMFAGTNLYTAAVGCPCGTKSANTGWGDNVVNTRVVCEVGTKSNEHWNNGVCTTDCTLGFTKLKTSTGLEYPILTNATTTHNVHIGFGGGVCTVPLANGTANNSINLAFNGNTYHAVVPDEIQLVGFTGQPDDHIRILGNLVDTNGTGVCYKSLVGSGSGGSPCEDNGDWATAFNYGGGTVYVKGISVCSSLEGSLYQPASNQSTPQLDYEYENGYNGTNCYCKLTDPAIENPKWIYIFKSGFGVSCTLDCARRCAENVQNESDARHAVFGVQ